MRNAVQVLILIYSRPDNAAITSGKCLNSSIVQAKFYSIRRLSELCKQYRLIAQANGISFQEAFPETFTITLPPKTFARAFSNILSNAVAYTLPGHSIFVRIDGRKLIVENECEPISAEHLKHIFEPFYRPDYARNQNDGGNGLGLYIVASILDSLKLSYSLEPIQKPLGMRFTITF